MRRNLLAKGVLGFLLLATSAAAARADVRLPGVFGEHMVLQRDLALPIWGWAEAGEKVSVTLAGQTKTATAEKEGHWAVKLDPVKAGGPHTLAVKANNTIQISDILVGEVWLCSGQSNMAMTVRGCKDYTQEQVAARYPKIRQFTVPRRSAKQPEKDCDGAWMVCSPETVGRFSGTAYFFARQLHKELDVPVGLINSSVGGTPIEAWTGPQNSGGLYNGMIAPLVPYAIRGAIWYQGERNARHSQPQEYAVRLPAMIRGWRKVWGQGEFPFYYVQLPNFRAPQQQPVETNGWVLIQEAMLKTLAFPGTGMAVTIDIGEARNIHPKNKQDVGKRLALWALAKTYGKDIVCCGPIYKSMKKQGQKIVVEFDHLGGGLVAKGEKLAGFAIAGADKKFVWADATIQDNAVVVSSPEVKDPAAVRYAWASNPKCSLYNKVGLPASPFRTDDWQQ